MPKKSLPEVETLVKKWINDNPTALSCKDEERTALKAEMVVIYNKTGTKVPTKRGIDGVLAGQLKKHRINLVAPQFTNTGLDKGQKGSENSASGKRKKEYADKHNSVVRERKIPMSAYLASKYTNNGETPDEPPVEGSLDLYELSRTNHNLDLSRLVHFSTISPEDMIELQTKPENTLQTLSKKFDWGNSESCIEEDESVLEAAAASKGGSTIHTLCSNEVLDHLGVTTVPPISAKSRESVWASPSYKAAMTHFVNKVNYLPKAERDSIKKVYMYSIQPNEPHYYDFIPHLFNGHEAKHCRMFFKKRGYAFFPNCQEIDYDHDARARIE
jgi:hypothetical protein